MSQAVSVAIAEEVRKRIRSANTLSERDFTVTRSYLEWDLELKGLENAGLQEVDKLLIDVVAHTTEQQVELSARDVLRYTVPIDIAIRRKFGEDKKDQETGRIKVEEIDKLVLLTEEVHGLFIPARLTEFPYHVWDNDKGGTQIVVNPHREHLRELRQFTSIVRTFLRADRNLNG